MPQVCTGENVLLRAFDVDLEKVHLSPHELGPDVTERADIHSRLGDLEACGEMTPCNTAAQR